MAPLGVALVLRHGASCTFSTSAAKTPPPGLGNALNWGMDSNPSSFVLCKLYSVTQMRVFRRSAGLQLTQTACCAMKYCPLPIFGIPRVCIASHYFKLACCKYCAWWISPWSDSLRCCIMRFYVELLWQNDRNNQASAGSGSACVHINQAPIAAKPLLVASWTIIASLPFFLILHINKTVQENLCYLWSLSGKFLWQILMSLTDFLPNAWRKYSLESPWFFFKPLLDLFISHMQSLIFFLKNPNSSDGHAVCLTSQPHWLD